MKKLPYHVGTWFAVTLRDGKGCGIGLVARMAPAGRIILACLFGVRLDHVPSISEILHLQPSDAIRCLRTGDLGLINGEWPIIGQSQGWEPAKWSMPPFVRRDELSKRAWRTIYSEFDPSHIEREEPVPYDTGEFERDALYGSGAVELLMTKLLASEQPQQVQGNKGRYKPDA